MDIYDIVVPKDNMLRQINDLVDFSFVQVELQQLKHRHWYDVASFSGLVGMQMQGAVAIFTVNLKRIITLMKDSKYFVQLLHRTDEILFH